jgi:predicted transcriptional regulator YheO
VRRIDDALRESRVAAERPFAMEVHAGIAPDLLPFLPLVRLMSDLFGGGTEIVLHDVRDVNHSVVVVANGELSGRRIGDPATDVMRDILRRDDLESRDYVVDYESRARNGAPFRSSLFFLRDEAGTIAGMISVNIELQRLFQAQDLFARLTRTTRPEGRPQIDRVNIASEQIAVDTIDAELASVGIHASAMVPADKLRVVQNLHERGVFRMRGSVPRVAKALMLSEPSVYRYLSTVKAAATRRDDPPAARDASSI